LRSLAVVSLEASHILTHSFTRLLTHSLVYYILILLILLIIIIILIINYQY
jgi:hypothetical protein